MVTLYSGQNMKSNTFVLLLALNFHFLCAKKHFYGDLIYRFKNVFNFILPEFFFTTCYSLFSNFKFV